MGDGPRVRLDVSCSGCDHELSEAYRCQGDSGHDVYCTHPTIGKRMVGDTKWATPTWCPLREQAIRKLCSNPGSTSEGGGKS